MDNSNSTSPPPCRQQGANNGDDSTEAANRLLDNRSIYPATFPLHHHQALLARGGQHPHQDYASLIATVARSMILLQGANAPDGQSPAQAQAFGSAASPALNIQGNAVVPLPGGQGLPWLMPPHQHTTTVSLAEVDPRLTQLTSSPSPNQLLAASALLTQISQANQHQVQLQRQASANLGAAIQAQLMPAEPTKNLPSGTNFHAGALGVTTQGDPNALLRALLSQQQSSVAPAHIFSLTQPVVASLLSSLKPGPSLAAPLSTQPISQVGAVSARLSDSRLNRTQQQEPQLSGRPPICLHLDLDEQTLSDYQCLLRKHIELFETRQEDIKSGVQGRNTPIRVGQVGIRCRHCSNVGKSETNKTCDTAPQTRRPKKGTIYYSRSLDGLYQVAQNLTKVHLCNSCPNIPVDAKARLSEMQKVNKRTSGGKEYWVYGLKELGVYEDKDNDMLRFRPLRLASARIDAGLEREATQGPLA